MGRQHQRMDWLEWNIVLRKAENRKEWRKLVVKSTVMAQRSARLWDKEDKIRSNKASYHLTLISMIMEPSSCSRNGL